MRSVPYWTFPEIADKTAETQHGKEWRAFTEYYLEKLVADFWLDHLPAVFQYTGSTEPPPVGRELVWGRLGPLTPRAFRRGVPTVEWKKLAAAKSGDYGYGLSNPGLRNTFFALLSLREDDACSWIDQQQAPKRRVGRPTQYDWDSFWREVVRVSHTPDGLPDKQAALEKAMLEWCELNWGRQPAESAVRDKLSRLDFYS